MTRGGEAALGGQYLEAAANRTELAKRLRNVWLHLTKLSQARGVCAYACYSPIAY